MSALPQGVQWGRILAGLGGGLMQAGSPQGYGGFGAGLMQGAAGYDDRISAQQMQEMRAQQMQLQQEQADAARSANAAAAAQQQQQQQFIQSLPPGLLTPQQMQFAQAYPEQAPETLGSALFPKPTEFKPNVEEFFSEDGKTKFKGYLDQQGNVVHLGGAAPLYAPQQGPQQPERVRLALEAGLQPNTPEYKQFLLGRDDTPPGLLQGTGLDQQMYNIVLSGTKGGDISTPEYAAAYAQLAMPKVTFDPVTQKMVSVSPDMSWAKKPTAASGAPTAPTAPTGAPPVQPGVETMQLPGATVTSTQGTPVYNDTQGKAAGFSDRMAESNAIFDDPSVANAGQSAAQSGLSAIPIIGNALTSANRQKFEQAERNFINSQLRRESGAVISPEEFANARKQYIPQFGDSKEVLAQKKANRQSNIDSMRRESGPFYKPKGNAPATGSGAPDYSKMSDEELLKYLQIPGAQ